MQKVVGSSPISRFVRARFPGGFFAFWGPFPRLRKTAKLRIWPIAGPMSASRELNQGGFGARAEQLSELLRGVSADVENLLVDAHRELRVRVAEQVHRAAWSDPNLREERGERAAQAVRRQMRDRSLERLVRARVRGLDDVLTDGNPQSCNSSRPAAQALRGVSRGFRTGACRHGSHTRGRTRPWRRTRPTLP